jgi:hypothetical protein
MGLLQKVQGKYRLGNQTVPQVHWERWIYTSQDCNEMAFECLDCSLHKISVVSVRQDQLQVTILFDLDRKSVV